MVNDTITFSIPKELKTELKIYVAKNNTTITDVLNNYIKDLVENK